MEENQEIIGESFNFGPSLTDEITVINLVNSLADAWGEDFSFSSSDSNFKEAKLLKLNCDKANKLLDWRPAFTSLETIDMTAKWYKTFYKSEEEVINETDSQILLAMKKLKR